MTTLASVSPSSASTGVAAAQAGVSKDEFLKLLVTQMQNQDPLKPDSDTAYVAQLAQFATLEQATNQTQLLQALGGQLSANAASQSVDLVGRTVTARFDHLTLSGSGAAPALRFTLDGAASQVSLVIKDAAGKVVRTVQTGPQGIGPQALAWDGRSDSGQALPAGAYSVTASAQTAAGQSVGVRTEVSGAVTGVSFASGRPVLVLGDAQVGLGDVVEVRR